MDKTAYAAFISRYGETLEEAQIWEDLATGILYDDLAYLCYKAEQREEAQ